MELKLAPSSKGRKVFSVCHQKFAVIDGETCSWGAPTGRGPRSPRHDTGQFIKGNREWIVRIDDAGSPHGSKGSSTPTGRSRDGMPGGFVEEPSRS